MGVRSFFVMDENFLLFRKRALRLLELMKEEGIGDIPIVVGGVIPKQDIPELTDLGIKGVFPGGTPFDEIVAGIEYVVK